MMAIATFNEDGEAAAPSICISEHGFEIIV